MAVFPTCKLGDEKSHFYCEEHDRISNWFVLLVSARDCYFIEVPCMNKKNEATAYSRRVYFLSLVMLSRNFLVLK